MLFKIQLDIPTPLEDFGKDSDVRYAKYETLLFSTKLLKLYLFPCNRENKNKSLQQMNNIYIYIFFYNQKKFYAKIYLIFVPTKMPIQLKRKQIFYT